jgi:hypothetical protein
LIFRPALLRGSGPFNINNLRAAPDRSKGFPFERSIPPLPDRDAVQHVPKPQAQGIGQPQADKQASRTLPLFGFGYRRALDAGQSAELLQGQAPPFALLPWRVDQDDTYIYYLLLGNGIMCAAVFSILYVISLITDHSINLYYMTISIDPNDKARSVAYAFSWKVAPLMLALFMPYAWLLFRANIDIRKFDLLKRVPKFATRMEGNRWRIIRWSLTVTILCLLDMFFTTTAIDAVFDHHLATPDSYGDTSPISCSVAVSFLRKHVRHSVGRRYGLPALAALRPLLQHHRIERK